MTTASAALVETIRNSGLRRVAFLGLAKNAGKTTALVATLAEMHRLGLCAGTTSAGRDGEAFDAVTGEPKPRFRVWPGQLVASASSTFDAASFPWKEVVTLPFPTRFGPVQIRRAESEGEIEVIGPSTASHVAEAGRALEQAGAAILLVDGAVGRRAFAALRVVEGIVLSVGMAAGGSMDRVLAAARGVVELIGLGFPAPGARARQHAGALNSIALRENPPRPGETLVAEDFTAVFLSSEERRLLRESGATLAVRRPARLLAITANPTAPGRPPMSAEEFFEALRREFPATPIFDLVGDRWSTAR